MIGALLAVLLPITVRSEPFPALDEPRRSGCLVVRSAITLTGSAPFGGYSDLIVDPAAGSALALSDAGHLLPLTLSFDEDGDVVAASANEWRPMTDTDGRTLDKATGDAEGLAPAGSGYLVSFEGEDRIAFLSPDGQLGAATNASASDEAVLGVNSGYESLASLSDGGFITISEGKDEEGYAIVRRGAASDLFSAGAVSAYRTVDDFAVTGLRQDPATGDLFVLERAWSPWRGARARIVRVAQDRLDAPVVEGRELGRLGFLEGIDNMEGLDLAHRPDGGLRLYLLSDDNFSPVQRTVLMTVGIAPPCAGSETPAEAAAGADAAAQEPVGQQEGR